LGEAYRCLKEFHAITLPILLITSEFGTMLMWDWEIASYLRSEGIETFAPNSLEQSQKILKILAVKREIGKAKFMVFQDNPGEGFQAPIFKRFYWWEDECTQRIMDMFGVQIEKKSFKTLGDYANSLPDEDASVVYEQWKDRMPLEAISEKQRNSALKVYLALREELDKDPHIQGMGINCLNESQYSDSTPCLAWNMLYEERRLIWGCEADTVSMLTKYLLHKSLGAPIMMTNLYPFLLGKAALKHERIPHFPEVEGNPDNYLLAAHCGYLGVLPQSFATEWELRNKVLAIVDPNATAIDARLPIGPISLVKLQPTMQSLSISEGELTGYVQYSDSDCLNGAVIRLENGRRFVEAQASHHYMLMTGHQLEDIRILANLYKMKVDIIKTEKI
jgi:L-fucose isomerase-like protein